MRYEFDAKNHTLGRIASKIAFTLVGKNKPSYKANIEPDNIVVVKNLKGAKFTGNKFNDKVYYRYSGYHSGIRARKLSELWLTRPEYVFRKMVYDMLPKNKTRDKIIKNLKFE